MSTFYYLFLDTKLHFLYDKVNLIMSFLSGKKLLLLGFIIVLLVAIPVTVYLVGLQQKTKTSAEAATTLSLLPTPLSKNVGDSVSFDVYVDPSNINQISYVTLVMSYDSTKLATMEGTFAVSQWPSADGSSFTPSIPIGPEYTPGTIHVEMSVGGSAQNVLKTRTKIATFTFKAIAQTEENVPTQVTFANQSQLLSLGGTGGTDEVGSNLISNTSPGSVNIKSTQAAEPVCVDMTLDKAASGKTPYTLKFTATGKDSDGNVSGIKIDFGDGEDVSPGEGDAGVEGYGTPIATASASHAYDTAGTYTATATITDDQDKQKTGCSKTITITQADENPTETPTLTPTPTGTTLSCTSLSLDPGASGTAPFSVNLTAVGTSTDSSISKVSFEFGDGETQDVTDAGGIGTNSISVLTSHTYASSGTFKAKATLTNEDGNTNTGSCVATISVSGDSEATPTEAIASPSPLPPTGPAGLITVGAIGVLLTFIGAILLLAL